MERANDMRVIVIKIPEEHYRTLQNAMKNHMESLIGKIILNGTPIPDNATNGDVIKTMFPNTEIMITDGKVFLRDGTIVMLYPLTWWNAPYQKGGKESEEQKHTCETCKHGKAYKNGGDITTMDDECGGCCSWNDKWEKQTAEK